MSVIANPVQAWVGCSRADWIYVLPVDRQSRILCLGENVLPLGSAFSERVYSVVVAIFGMRDLGESRRHGLRSETIETVVVEGVGSGRTTIPFRSSSFDFIFWNTGATREAVTGALLGSVSHTVRPGGSIAFCLTASRRTAFVSLSPWIKKLRAAGWREIKIYWVYPDLQNCQWVMPIDDRKVAASCLDLLTRGSPPLRSVRIRLASALSRRGFPVEIFNRSALLVIGSACTSGFK